MDAGAVDIGTAAGNWQPAACWPNGTSGTSTSRGAWVAASAHMGCSVGALSSQQSAASIVWQLGCFWSMPPSIAVAGKLMLCRWPGEACRTSASVPQRGGRQHGVIAAPSCCAALSVCLPACWRQCRQLWLLRVGQRSGQARRPPHLPHDACGEPLAQGQRQSGAEESAAASRAPPPPPAAASKERLRRPHSRAMHGACGLWVTLSLSRCWSWRMTRSCRSCTACCMVSKAPAVLHI